MTLRSLLLAALVLTPGIARPAEVRPDSQVELGRKLFEQGWLRPPADDSPLAPPPGGDGLGPVFNAGSCVACHRQGGTGGGGPRSDNVDVISVVLPFGVDEATKAQTLRRAAALHPAFRGKTHVILHRFGRDAEGALDVYEAFRTELIDRFPELPRPAAQTEIEHDGVKFQLAQRNTTAMFGGGVIDQIPPEALVRLAEWQKANHPDQAGRAALNGRGRFGWRGQVDSLDAFVRMACADECGLRVPSARRGLHEQWAWPVRKQPIRHKSRGTDLTKEQTDALVAFSAALPAPRPVPPAGPVERAAAEAGRRHFDRIGCAVCHVEHLGPAEHIYSDLLLHDLGRPLADRVKAPPVAPPSIREFSATKTYETYQGYYNEFVVPASVTRTRTVVTPPSLNDFEITMQEWKTPPLWGVADSAPYLHDGRAETLDDAIRAHSGQAEESAKSYASLPTNEQAHLLAFLRTLKAPQQSATDATTGPLN